MGGLKSCQRHDFYVVIHNIPRKVLHAQVGADVDRRRSELVEQDGKDDNERKPRTFVQQGNPINGRGERGQGFSSF